MGVGGISIWQLLIILVIVLLLFGTKKLRNIGGDLGGAIKSFKKSVKDTDAEDEENKEDGEASADSGARLAEESETLKKDDEQNKAASGNGSAKQKQS